MSDEEVLEAYHDDVGLLEEMFERYKLDPTSVDKSWHPLFDHIQHEFFDAVPHTNIQPGAVDNTGQDDVRIYHLIQAYREYGHLMAAVNPIATQVSTGPRELKLSNLGFKTEDLNKSFRTFGLLETETAPLSKIIEVLKEIYCKSIGWEYMGCQSPDLEKWIQQRIEPLRSKTNLSIDQKQMILQHLNKSELFEIFLNTKFVGQKRFSLEGSETLIPIMATIIEQGANLGVEDFVIGMPHRGRLNVLCNIIGKSYSDIFFEFEDHYIPDSFEGSGDVKYHKGYLAETITEHGHRIQISLTPNPSHLESVDPVVEGEVYAVQVMSDDLAKKERSVPLLIHGDAAIAGQGVVYETLQLSKLPGYSTGGTIHVVINNQIGFTTLPSEGRSTFYCTDIAKAFGAPVFHVNAEDPEGCVFVSQLAMDLRQKFHCDVFIELNCYRKYGHNETDEPAYTQPLEYRLIRPKKAIREIYRDNLINQGMLEKHMAEKLEAEFKIALQEELKDSRELHEKKEEPSTTAEATPITTSFPKSIETGVSFALMRELAENVSKIPDDFTIHPKLANLIKDRLSMVSIDKDAKPLDWGMGETLAYATLLAEGVHVRISGQDCCRGTFSHRHAMWIDQNTSGRYIPLRNVYEGQGRFDIYNSPLSEFAVLGFEFGYSFAYPDSLVIWEAQFGDFANGAQVIIDQYIASGEQKWGRKTGLTLFLPHGYEGQGSEHSSGRMERFLSLAGHQNMIITNPTLPAQLFHLLRRQVKQPIKKPLIVFTPKGLLRHPQCVSPMIDFTKGSFQEILDDPNPPENVDKVVLCSGRVYYDLLAEKIRTNASNIVMIRIEQLYPFNGERLREILAKYTEASSYVWVQEEPHNMGAWDYIHPVIQAHLPENHQLNFIGRSRSASPAVGSHALHKNELSSILKQVFNVDKPHQN